MPSVNYQDVINEMQNAQQRANEANRQRYQNLLNVVDNAQTQTQDLLQSGAQQQDQAMQQAASQIGDIGGAAYQRVNKNLAQNQGELRQDLTSRGLANTTVLNSAQRGIENQAEFQKQGIDSMLAKRYQQQYNQMGQADMNQAQTRASSFGQLAQYKGQAIEGRYDTFNPQPYMQALRSAQANAAPDDGQINAFVPNTPGPASNLSSPNYTAALGGGGGGGVRQVGGGSSFGPDLDFGFNPNSGGGYSGGGGGMNHAYTVSGTPSSGGGVSGGSVLRGGTAFLGGNKGSVRTVRR